MHNHAIPGHIEQREGGGSMLGFLLGCVVGGTVGMTVTCLCTAAGQADRWMEQTE